MEKTFQFGSFVTKFTTPTTNAREVCKTRFFVHSSQAANQCVTVPEMLNDIDTDTFFRYQIFSIPIPVLFRYQILPIPIPRFSSGTKLLRYRIRN